MALQSAPSAWNNLIGTHGRGHGEVGLAEIDGNGWKQARIVAGDGGAAYHLICRVGAIIQGTPAGLISLDISSFTRGL